MSEILENSGLAVSIEEVAQAGKIKRKRTLDFSSALVYNLLRKVLGIEVSDCPQYETIKK